MQLSSNHILGKNFPEIQELLLARSNTPLYQKLSWHNKNVIEILQQKPLPKNFGRIEVTNRSIILSSETLNIKDEIAFILNPPVYAHPVQRLLSQKKDIEHTRELLSYVLPQRIQAGALADIAIGKMNPSQKKSELFSQQFASALKSALEWQFPDSQIPGWIIQIFRGIVRSIYDTTSWNNWKESLQNITLNESRKLSISDSSSHALISKELMERLILIFELFEENYIKTLWDKKV